MKLLLFSFLFFISFLSFSQNNHIVKTEDGRRVLLKADFTWEYIDMKSPSEDNSIAEAINASKKDSCGLEEDFEEPKLNNKIQSSLKKGRATIKYVKEKVANDLRCEIEDVLLISFNEKKEKATYIFCVKGEKTTYKRVGHSIIKARKYF